MHLRELKDKDALAMLTWMHNEETVRYLAGDFENKTLDDCKVFIAHAQTNKEESLHYAICNEQDEYQGTISLKNIDKKNETAEYAIAVGPHARGSGIAYEATQQLLELAFEQQALNRLYLCVTQENIRAIAFYEKCGFTYEGAFRKHCRGKDSEYTDLCWYGILREEWEVRKKESATC